MSANSRISDLGILAVAFAIFTGTLFGQASAPYEIVANELGGPRTGEITRRHIFIYWEESSFDWELVIQEIKNLSDEFQTPANLRIAVYSDREMLERLRKFEANPIGIQFRQDEAGRKAELEYYSRVYPSRQGYFRVDYARNANFEFLDHNPDKDSPRTERINLKNIAPRPPSEKSSLQEKEWLDYWPTVVELMGELSVEAFFGPPNFGEDPETDAKERHWILNLDKPINVRGRKDPDPGLAPSVENVSKLQLVLSKSAEELVGKRVTVKGTLFHAHTGHHHTDVLLEVETIGSAEVETADTQMGRIPSIDMLNLKCSENGACMGIAVTAAAHFNEEKLRTIATELSSSFREKKVVNVSLFDDGETAAAFAEGVRNIAAIQNDRRAWYHKSAEKEVFLYFLHPTNREKPKLIDLRK